MSHMTVPLNGNLFLSLILKDYHFQFYLLEKLKGDFFIHETHTFPASARERMVET